MSKITRTLVAGLTAATLALSGTAHAAATRSASALPQVSSAVATPALSRTSAPAAEEESSIGGVPLLLLLLSTVSAVAGVIELTDDSPGG